MDKRNIYRIIDANLNRAREGIRVVEEVARLYFDDAKLSAQLKTLRHDLSKLAKKSFDQDLLLTFRDSLKDVGADSMSGLERKRPNLYSVVQANLRRSQEAARVLEEFGKLVNPDSASSFKKIRFKLYTLEKIIFPIIKNR
jgi:thiamine-phosphate pyrophosphorylase